MLKLIKIAANTPLAPDASPAVAPDLNLAVAVTPDTRLPGHPSAPRPMLSPAD